MEANEQVFGSETGTNLKIIQHELGGITFALRFGDTVVSSVDFSKAEAKQVLAVLSKMVTRI